MDDETEVTAVEDEFNSNELTESEVLEATEEEDSSDSAADAVAALDAVDVGEDEPEAADPAAPAPVVVSDEDKKIASQLTAAAVTGVVCEGIQFLTYPTAVNVPDEMRQRLAGDLAPVLAKHDGVMPPWLAKFVSSWKEEMQLAKTLAVFGFAVHRQYKEEQERGGDKPRHRVVAGVGANA